MDIQKTISALATNGIKAVLAKSSIEAKELVLQLIPEGSEVFTMTSVSLETLGLDKEINESGKYVSVRKALEIAEGREKKRLGSAPEWAIGSVHAVTEDGKILIASNTGSQLAAYVYGADHVVWVVGTQKVVADEEAAVKRVYETVLPLESVRVQKAYGMPHSNVSKLLTISKEVTPDRITIIFVEEILGY